MPVWEDSKVWVSYVSSVPKTEEYQNAVTSSSYRANNFRWVVPHYHSHCILNTEGINFFRFFKCTMRPFFLLFSLFPSFAFASTFCTMEVQQCPDGSFVSRNSEKNCAFDLCPTSPSSEFFGYPFFRHRTFGCGFFLKEHGIVQGYSDKTYRPEAQINRYDFTKIIVLSRIDQKEIQNCNKKNNILSRCSR